MTENKYTPFTKDQFDRLKDEINSISTYIPESKMSYIWSSFTKLKGKKEPQPCGCKSAAKHWSRAYNELNKFVKENQ